MIQMWQRASAKARWALVVAVGALILAAINVWWFETYRHGYPFDIDEAGYTTFGLIDYLGLKYNGIHGWWSAIQGQPTFAPLVPALTSLVVYVKPGLMDGFAVLSGFLVVLAMATYGTGVRLVGPRLGALAALVTAALPGAFTFSREYIYALPVAALLVCAVYALLRSDGLRIRRWAIACGVAIGLMLLARTMAIAYVPGVLVAALTVLIARGHNDFAKRIVNLALLVAVAVGVAAIWYARNLQSVIKYLTNYGYGSQSRFYGAKHSLISWGRLRTVADRLVASDLLFPLALLFSAALVALLVVVIRRLRPPRTRWAVLKHLAATDALSVALVFLVGYGALMSSQNGGDGFTFPLAALLPVLAVLALRSFPSALVPSIAALGLITAVNLVSTSDIWAAASHPRLLSVPLIDESFLVTNGVPNAVEQFREQVPGPESIFDAQDSRWLRADKMVANALAALYGPDGEAPVVAFASRSRALNTNTVQLASVMKYNRGIPFNQFLAEPNDSVATYVKQLTNPDPEVAAGIPTVLITTSRNTGDFSPVVTQTFAETAARRVGFRKIRTMTMPDGRDLYIWQKDGRR
jgi:4-amino-4-deoxy-L-arabinose transferase-like glycosyltransferase